ncbi:hypothetical protein MAR_035717 [Mya arenaria]|uniref:Uncharacterized protein n=1 Tax=Mya arenaria TaxID=6604 RepID=A0ABY7EPJ6_MYAAR|nr:hypothetical protein MAR_035717 [Mya arenaria]
MRINFILDLCARRDAMLIKWVKEVFDKDDTRKKATSQSRESSRSRDPGQCQQTISQFVRMGNVDTASCTPNKGKQPCAPERSPPTPVEVIHEQATTSKEKKNKKSYMP